MPIFSDYDIEHSYYNSDALVRIQKLIAEHSKIEGRKRSFCVKCGYIDYKNPLPVAASVVPNEQGEILIVRCANHPMRGMWCLPCGFAEIDEEMNEAALRELEEETGLVAEQCTLLDVSNSHNYFYGNLLMVTYRVHATHGRLRPGDDAMETRYFTIDDMSPLVFFSHEKALNLYSSRDIETGEDQGEKEKKV